MKTRWGLEADESTDYLVSVMATDSSGEDTEPALTVTIASYGRGRRSEN